MSRDIQCRWCWGWGHNRRTCPEAAAEALVVENIVQKHNIKVDDYDRKYGYTSATLHAIRELASSENIEEPTWRNFRAWGERLKREHSKEQRKAQGGRRCGFCSETGHNARTCDEKKSFAIKCRALRALAHRVVRSQLESSGLVPGALVSWEVYEYNVTTNPGAHAVSKYGLVSSINWNEVAVCDLNRREGAATEIESWYKNRALIEVRETNGDTRFMGLPRNITQQTDYYYSPLAAYNENLTSPVKNRKIKVNSDYLGDEITLIDPTIQPISYSTTVADEEWGKELARLLREVGADKVAKQLNLDH